MTQRACDDEEVISRVKGQRSNVIGASIDTCVGKSILFYPLTPSNNNMNFCLTSLRRCDGRQVKGQIVWVIVWIL